LPINRLLQEHRVVAAAGDERLKRLNEAVHGALISRETLETAAAIYFVYTAIIWPPRKGKSCRAQPGR